MNAQLSASEQVCTPGDGHGHVPNEKTWRDKAAPICNFTLFFLHQVLLCTARKKVCEPSRSGGRRIQELTAAILCSLGALDPPDSAVSAGLFSLWCDGNL